MTEERVYKLPLFIYDDSCPLCVRFKISLERIPESHIFTMVPLADKQVYEHFPELNPEECKREFHLIDEFRDVFRGHEAIGILIKTYPAVEKFSWLMESKMGSKALEYFYKMSNKYRQSLLNKCRTCR